MKQPLIVLVGRTNVGKSTLFNTLTKSRKALVLDCEGFTRDRQYGSFKISNNDFEICDTGGLLNGIDNIDKQTEKQTQIAIKQADLFYFIVSCIDGVTTKDLEIAQTIRISQKPCILLVNKSQKKNVGYDFFQLGFKNTLFISAKYNIGINDLKTTTTTILGCKKNVIDFEDKKEKNYINIALLGRQNVGKSSLINAIVGKDRQLVSDVMGTTRDSVSIDFNKKGINYRFVDTAGIRRKKKYIDKIEAISISKALSAVDLSDIVMLMIDANIMPTEQDNRLFNTIHQKGVPVILLVNKSDVLDQYKRQQLTRLLNVRFRFIPDIKIFFISAIKNQGIEEVFTAIDNIYKQTKKEFKTSYLNRILEQAVIQHTPPMISGRRIKLKFINQLSQKPLRFIIYINKFGKLSDSYVGYLKKFFKNKMDIPDIPVSFVLKQSDNPYFSKKNK